MSQSSDKSRGNKKQEKEAKKGPDQGERTLKVFRQPLDVGGGRSRERLLKN